MEAIERLRMKYGRPTRVLHALIAVGISLELWGPAMWGYLGIHAGATVAHLALGHRSILSIFRW